MSKKNLPHIPIYIGDWERDCNVLSLESEAAWMRIVFKLWTKGKQNTIKMPAKSLQNLWRCGEEKMQDILNDLTYNEICEITHQQGFVEFTCRRFVKENHLSEIRSNAAKSKNKVETKSKQTTKQNKSKSEQNADNDNDIVIDNDINNDFDIEILECFEKCKKAFPEHLHPKTKAQEKKWIEVVDKLHRIDGVPYQTIHEITLAARNDDFWKKNFLSLTKLRNKNKDGIMYVVYFAEQFKNKKPKQDELRQMHGMAALKSIERLQKQQNNE